MVKKEKIVSKHESDARVPLKNSSKKLSKKESDALLMKLAEIHGLM